MAELRKVYIVYTEQAGEVEGAFDEQENLLSYWACSDASWRHEYFAEFLEKLGLDTDPEISDDLRGRLEAKLAEAANETWG